MYIYNYNKYLNNIWYKISRYISMCGISWVSVFAGRPKYGCGATIKPGADNIYIYICYMYIYIYT